MRWYLQLLLLIDLIRSAGYSGFFFFFFLLHFSIIMMVYGCSDMISHY